jgi:hypothetical protein
MITGTFDRLCRLWHTSVPRGPESMRTRKHKVEQHQVSTVAVEHVQRIGAGPADGDLKPSLRSK